MKRLICLTICILCLCASPAYGNSAPSYWGGFPYSDVLAVQQDSPITVDSERLIFDFSQSVDGEGWAPSAKVSADYRMTNPTEETLSVQMAFPFVAKLSSLSVPDITVNADHAAIPYDIYIDPEDVYPDGSSGGDFHFDYGAIGNISNQEWTLPGFGPDSKAKLYRFAVSVKQEDRLDLEISFNVDPDQTILIGKGFNGASYSEEGNEKLSAAIWGEIQPEILVLGRNLPLTFEVLTHEGKIADKNRYRLEVTEEPADIREYLLSTLRESLSKETVDAVSDTQLFNLCLHEIDRERRSTGYMVLSDFPAVFDDRIFTLVYQVDFPPGSSRSVSVGYIAEGTMDRRETVTPKYSYTYLLSPAENWADFGSLDVEIITPREAPYIIESSLELSQSGQNRYNARFEGLPGSELTFTLYQKEKITLTDKTSKTVSDLRYFTIFFWPVFFIVLLIIAVFAVRSIIRGVRSNRRPFMWITAILVLIMIFASIGLLSDTGNKTESTRQEINSMAETWAEALKTRDGEPRYEIMSQDMKEQFVEGQKLRSEPWNFNIGVSSPWVVDYEITVTADSAEILYHLTDSTQQIYDKKEIIYFGKENGKVTVVGADELLNDWERYYYYAPTAEEAMQVYTKALLESDYLTILSLTHTAKLEPVGQQLWNTIKISKVRVAGEDVRDYNACYELELTIEDGGGSSFEKGISPRWLWLVKGDQGWYAEGLMSGGAPDQNWWSSGVPKKIRINTESWNTGSFEFNRLIYLSPLSSSTFDYAENRMKGTEFTISDDLFEIDYPDQDDLTIQQPVYARETMTDDMIRTFEKSTMHKVFISEYTGKYRYTIYTNDNHKIHFRLYVLDGQVWLSSYADNTADKSEIVMDLYELK